jgi:zinc transport system ATP-binding protein
VPLIELDSVRFAYPGGPLVLDDISLRVEAGEFVGIAGPNGGGKTTLVRLVVGLEEPTAGRVSVFGSPPRRLPDRWRIGYLPQRARLGTEAPVTVLELVTAGRASRTGVARRLRDADRAAVAHAIELVGLGAEARRPVRVLSGGQQQRAFIAKTLAAEPELLVLDEPTAGVDARAQDALAELIVNLGRELGVTVLCVSHEFGPIEPHLARIVVVRGGIAYDGHPSGLHAGHEHGHVPL